ncbi:MAG: hypothetical protein RBR16_13580 [Syntrophus sp. (in: bacteria)]|nr:hypothetical protein [Syntrophus sp. (in: bacteria)]
MKRKMKAEELRKLGIIAKKRGNDWEIFLNGHLAMIGLSDKDVELLQQKSPKEMVNILSMI